MSGGERFQTGEEPESRRKEKAALRKRILKERDSLPPELRQAFDRQILEQLIRYEGEEPCDAYLCYVNFRSEVATKELIGWCLQRGKVVFVPKVLEDGEMEFYRISGLEELQAGCLGILEPKALRENSFSRWMERGREGLIRILMPGAVFDRKGNRIGYGGGFYDRWLAKWEGKPGSGMFDPGWKLEKIALAYEMQMVEEIPAESFDRKADLVVTEGQAAGQLAPFLEKI